MQDNGQRSKAKFTIRRVATRFTSRSVASNRTQFYLMRRDTRLRRIVNYAWQRSLCEQNQALVNYAWQRSLCEQNHAPN